MMSPWVKPRLPPLAVPLSPALAGAFERLDVAACDIDRRLHRNRVADIVRERGLGPLAQASRGDQPVSRELQYVLPVDVGESRKLRHCEVHGLQNEYPRAADSFQRQAHPIPGRGLVEQSVGFLVVYV